MCNTCVVGVVQVQFITMIKTLLLLAVATTMATAQNIGDCQRAYRPAADPADCSALLQIARCEYTVTRSPEA